MFTLQEAKDYLRHNWDKGTVCPCCTQPVKRYQRKLNAGMAITLVRIYMSGRKPLQVKDFLREKKFTNSHDWTLLKHWGLLKEEPNEGAGYWSITEKGCKFVMNHLRVPKHIFMFNKKFYGYSDKTTTIVESLGDKFDYSELMNQ